MQPAVWTSNRLDDRHPNLNAWYITFFQREDDKLRGLTGGAIGTAGGIAGAAMGYLASAMRIGPQSLLFYLPILFFIIVTIVALAWFSRSAHDTKPWRKAMRSEVLASMRNGALFARTGQMSLSGAQAISPLLEDAAQSALRAESLLQGEVWRTPALAPVGARILEAVDRAMTHAVAASHTPSQDASEIGSIGDELRSIVIEIEGIDNENGPVNTSENSARDGLRSVRAELRQLGEAHRELSDDESTDNQLQSQGR